MHERCHRSGTQTLNTWKPDVETCAPATHYVCLSRGAHCRAMLRAAPQRPASFDASRTSRTSRAAARMGASAPRRWRAPKTGNIAQLALEADTSVADGAPLAAGAVRVDVHAIGLNFADVFTALGLYAAAPKVRAGSDCGLVSTRGLGGSVRSARCLF